MHINAIARIGVISLMRAFLVHSEADLRFLLRATVGRAGIRPVLGIELQTALLKA
jgi:hypothetical protein